MIRIEEIVEKVGQNHPQADLNVLRRAYIFSAKHHKGQTRASGEPYLVHPLEVANILADMRLDEVSVATGLLHDVVEDTLVEPEVIRDSFGEEIAHLVDGLTKLAHISNQSREEQQAENVRKMLLAMVDDVRVVLVKLADRLHNMRTIAALPDASAEAKAQFARLQRDSAPAGVAADLRTFAACGVHVCVAVTAVALVSHAGDAAVGLEESLQHGGIVLAGPMLSRQG